MNDPLGIFARPVMAAMPVLAALAIESIAVAGEIRGWGLEHPRLDAPADLLDARRVVAGRSSTLAIRADGTLIGWGTLHGNPIVVPSELGPVIDASTTRNHVAAVRTNGSVLCWGDNQFGQCDVPSDLPPMKMVGAGWYFTVALGVDGALRVWTALPYSYGVPPGTDFVRIAVSQRGFLALRSNGTIAQWGGMVPVPPASIVSAVDVACTDYLGIAALSDGTVKTWALPGTSNPPPPTSAVNAVRVSCGLYRENPAVVRCSVIRADGSLVSWANSVLSPGNFPSGSGSDLALGPEHSVVVRRKGTVDCLAHRGGTWVHVTMPPPELGREVAAVTAGSDRSTILNEDGSIVYWGNFESLDYFPPPQGPGAAVQLDTANGQSIARRADGTIFAFNCEDTLGWCSKVNATQDATDIVQVSCGPYHALALREDGTVRAWGTPNSFTSAAQVPPGLNGVRQIEAGGTFSYAVRSDGSVVRWGYEPHGYPSDFGLVSSLAAGWSHVVALRADGSVNCWGSNVEGQRNVPPGLSDVVAVEAGLVHTLALRANGTVVAWGGYDGEKSVPSDLRHVRSVHAGYTHSLAIVDDSCVGDLDRDGAVMGADLGVLLTQWGQVGAPRGDINADGVVDSIDLGFLIGQWGPCPE
jgi:alpha-tubulin suppressor-like RCC1 family protein